MWWEMVQVLNGAQIDGTKMGLRSLTRVFLGGGVAYTKPSSHLLDAPEARTVPMRNMKCITVFD